MDSAASCWPVAVCQGHGVRFSAECEFLRSGYTEIDMDVSYEQGHYVHRPWNCSSGVGQQPCTDVRS